MDLDPHSSLTQGNLGWIYWCARRYGQAIEQFKIAIAREPTFNFNYWGIGLSYAAVGRFEDSIKSMQKYVEFSGGGGDSLGGLGWAYGMAGRRDEALAVLAKLKELEKKGNVEKIAFALVHTGLGSLRVVGKGVRRWELPAPVISKRGKLGRSSACRSTIRGLCEKTWADQIAFVGQ